MARNDPLFEAWTPSRSLDAYLQSRAGQMQDPAWRQLLGVTPASLSEYAGAPGGTSRAQELAPNYGAVTTAGEVMLPDVQEETSGPGVVESFLNFIDRPRSAIIGFATGYDRLTRYGDEARGVSEDVVGPEESRLQAGLRRAAESLRGEENYRFQDFTNIARKEDASGGEKFGNAALGFVIDTVIDPITYLSLGGSILGRKNASEYVTEATRAMITRRGVDSAPRKLIKQQFSRADFNPLRYLQDSVENNAFRKDVIVQQLNDVADELAKSTGSEAVANMLKNNRFAITDNWDEVAKKAEKIYRATNIDVLREQSLRIFPMVAGNMYAAGNAKALRRYLGDVFGKDFGDEFMRLLPYDIQGGLRFRIPFSKNAQGIPVAYKLPGVGMGQLSDKFKFIDRASEMTEAGRYYASRLFSGVLRHISGRNGAKWFEAVNETRGRIILGKRNTGAVAFSDYMYKQMTDRANSALRVRLNKDIHFGVKSFAKVYQDFIEEYSSELGGEREVHRLFGQIFGTEDGFKRVSKAVEDGTATAVEEAMFTAGAPIRMMLDSLGETMAEEFGMSKTQSVNLMNYYLPHHVEARRAAEQAIGAKGGLAGVKVNPTKARNRGLAGFTVTKEGGIEKIRWMGAVDINDWEVFAQNNSGNLFIENPLDYIPAYLSEVTRAIEDIHYTNLIRKYRLLSPAIMEKYTDFDLTLLRFNAAQFWESDQRRVAESIFDDFDRLLGEELPEDIVADSAQARRKFVQDKVGEIRASDMDTLTERLRSVGVTIESDDEIARAWRKVNRSDDYYNPYLNMTATQDSAGRWYLYFGKDKTKKYVYDKRGKVLYFKAEEPDQILANLYQASITRNHKLPKMIADARRSITAERYWQSRHAFYGVLLNEPQFTQGLLDMDNLSSMPVEDAKRLIELHVQQVTDALEFFGRAEGKATAISINGRTGTVAQQIRQEKERATESFKNFLQAEGYININQNTLSASGPGRGRDQIVQVKQRIANELADSYGPYALMASISRQFRILKDPETWGERFIQHFLKPFYALNKVALTLGRGIGFIVRNIMGGMWNLTIQDVGRIDMAVSAHRLTADAVARNAIKRKYGKDIFDLDPVSVAEEFRELFRQNMEKFYGDKTGTFIAGTKDIDAVMDMEDAFLAQGMDASSLSSRLVGEILNSGREGATRVDVVENGRRVTKWIYPSSATEIEGTKIATSETIGRTEKALRWLATENPWIKKFLGPLNDSSENYLRFAAFSKGVRDFGLEPDPLLRGYAASLWTKWTQFDYADLSDFERTLGKSVIPFWTWARYNMPLVARTMIHRPGPIAQAVRAHEALGSIFAEEDEDGWPSSSFLKERFGFTIPEETVRSAFEAVGISPDSAIVPKGDVGLALFLGENINDINRLFKVPGEAGFRGLQSVFNTREIWQNGNPLLAGLGTLFAGAEGDPTVSLTDTEQAPGWMSWLPGRTDPVTGERIVSRYVTEATRTFFPYVRHLERYAPTVFGGEREPGRWFTSVVSGLFGLPVSTEDDWKAASEMDRRTDFVRLQLEDEFGRSAAARIEMVRDLLAEGAPMSFIQNLEIQDMADDEVDVANAIHTWRAMQRINYLLQIGVPQEDIAIALMAYLPDDAEIPDDWQTLIYQYLPKPALDVTNLSNQFGLRPPTPEELAAVGVTPDQVRLMNDDEKRQLIARLYPDRFSLPYDQARYLEWLRTQDF